MVRLSQIYTKTGDDGSTGLGDGSRVSKTDLRVEAYGTVDEANSFIGLAWTIANRSAHTALADSSDAVIASILRVVQNDLFDVGADLCCPIEAGEARGVGEVAGARLRVVASQTLHLEELIDEHNADLQPLNSFILPSGSEVAASLHVARTVVRRAERCAVNLVAHHAQTVNMETVRYLNRLSDLLFVLARVANARGRNDVKWVPGASRNRETASGASRADTASHSGESGGESGGEDGGEGGGGSS